MANGGITGRRAAFVTVVESTAFQNEQEQIRAVELLYASIQRNVNEKISTYLQDKKKCINTDLDVYEF